jgi:hypothetical protein
MEADIPFFYKPDVYLEQLPPISSFVQDAAESILLA